jgi:hypothetical protein
MRTRTTRWGMNTRKRCARVPEPLRISLPFNAHWCSKELEVASHVPLESLEAEGVGKNDVDKLRKFGVCVTGGTHPPIPSSDSLFSNSSTLRRW